MSSLPVMSFGADSRMYGLSFSSSLELVPFEPPPQLMPTAPETRANVRVNWLSDRRIASAPRFWGSLAALFSCFAFAFALRLLGVLLGLGERAHLGHAVAGSGHARHAERHSHAGH